jgi:hypothetical protein
MVLNIDGMNRRQKVLNFISELIANLENVAVVTNFFAMTKSIKNLNLRCLLPILEKLSRAI